MSEKRYHVYISTSFDDVKTERLKLQLTLLGLNAFPWEFNERRTSLNTALARKQIDDCDYVIFLIGGKYGDLSASGISYVHLDFLYALNKQKTILCFIDNAFEKRPEQEREVNLEIQRKFSDFKALLKKEVPYCYDFNSVLDLDRAIKKGFAQAIEEKPALGWVRPRNNDVLQNEIIRLRQKNVQLEQELEKMKYDPAFLINHNATSKNLTPTVVAKAEKISVVYRTHAYQDGNLKEIYPQREMTWHSLLQVLAPHFVRPAIEASFLRVMNHYLENTALADARMSLPRAHAVARTQIDEHCLQQIKLQMKWNNWIVPQNDANVGSRNYWQLTQEGQRQLARVST